MMGERRVMQEALFYGFSFERHIPDNHLLRKIDRFVDLSGTEVASGAVLPRDGSPFDRSDLMMRMLIVGYCFGIRSERRLCERVHLNLAYRWFCRVGARCRPPRSFDVFKEPPWPFPRKRQAATKGAIAATWIERDLWQGDTEPGQADRQAGREQGRSCVEISALSFVRTQMESVPFGPKPPLLLGAGLSDGVCLTPGHGGLMPIGGAHRPSPAHTKGVEFRCCSMRLSSL